MMTSGERLLFLDNLRTFLIFLVVVVHAAIVYESSGAMVPNWIVVDPTTSDAPGLMILLLDLLIIPTLFFISGYLAPGSLARKGGWRFLRSRFRRLVVPWLLAVFTLMPLYKVVLLYSRGLPQEHWTTYFHFSNGELGMNWLWFLPVLFLFDLVYLSLWKPRLPTFRLALPWAVLAVFLANFAYSVMIGAAGWTGWTRTPLVDFQNERLLPYFLAFLLGSACHRLRVFATESRNVRLYVAIAATLWVTMSIYVVLVLNFVRRPGSYFVSQVADALLLWLCLHLSLLGLLYCALTTFKYLFDRQRRLGATLTRLSLNVYILHMIVMAPFALALRQVDVAATLKYPVLVLATYTASNLIALAWAHVKSRLPWHVSPPPRPHGVTGSS